MYSVYVTYVVVGGEKREKKRDSEKGDKSSFVSCHARTYHNGGVQVDLVTGRHLRFFTNIFNVLVKEPRIGMRTNPRTLFDGLGCRFGGNKRRHDYTHGGNENLTTIDGRQLRRRFGLMNDGAKGRRPSQQDETKDDAHDEKLRRKTTKSSRNDGVGKSVNDAIHLRDIFMTKHTRTKNSLRRSLSKKIKQGLQLTLFSSTHHIKIISIAFASLIRPRR